MLTLLITYQYRQQVILFKFNRLKKTVYNQSIQTGMFELILAVAPLFGAVITTEPTKTFY